MSKSAIAVLGAGLSGLVLAEKLAAIADVSLFEKSRGVGGRMATRYTTQFEYDHGAPFFTARSKVFKEFLAPYIAQGSVRPWTPRVMTLESEQKPYRRDWFEPHYVASPRMNSLCHQLAQSKQLSRTTEIINLDQKKEAGWFLQDKHKKHGPFDYCLLSIPAPQIAKLLKTSIERKEAFAEVEMQGCFSLMLGFDKPIEKNWDAAVVKHSPIAWIASGDSKPGRGEAATLVLHASHTWSQAHFDDEKDKVIDLLLVELERILGGAMSAPLETILHRWRYAHTPTPGRTDYFYDEPNKLGICGDWFLNGTVESAFLSARALAATIKRQIN